MTLKDEFLRQEDRKLLAFEEAGQDPVSAVRTQVVVSRSYHCQCGFKARSPHAIFDHTKEPCSNDQQAE